MVHLTLSWYKYGGTIGYSDLSLCVVVALSYPFHSSAPVLLAFHSPTCSCNGSISCHRCAELAFWSKHVVTGTFCSSLLVCALLTLQEPSPRIKHFSRTCPYSVQNDYSPLCHLLADNQILPRLQWSPCKFKIRFFLGVWGFDNKNIWTKCLPENRMW